MKRLTLDLLLVGTLAVAPAAWAQDLPGTQPATPRDTTAPAGSTTGSVPAPSQRRDKNTTPGSVTPDDPGIHGRNGVPPTATPPSRTGIDPMGTTPVPDNTNPVDTTRPYGGAPRAAPPSPSNPAPADPAVPGSPAPGAPGTPSSPGRPTERGTTATDTPTVPPTPTTAAATAGAEGDAEVIAKVHEANQKEIEMAQMALDKGESPRVKSYARKLLSDHTAADKKLMSYAEKKGVDLGKAQARATGTGASPATGTAAAPSTGDDEAHRQLQAATGAEFDRQFVTLMLGEHEKALDLVKSARQSVTDKELRSLLGSIQPKLEQHRKLAQDIASKQSKS